MERIDIIRNRILGKFPDVYDKTEGTVLWDMAQSYALELDLLYAKIDSQRTDYFLANIKDPEIFDLKIDDYGEKRKEAIAAEGIISLKGTPGVFVEKGSLVATELTEYATLNSVFISNDGTVDVPIKCVIAGKIGNATVGVINKFPLTISGVYECVNKAVIENGVDLEDMEETRKRITTSLKEPKTSGNVFDYKDWAKEVPTVGNARVIPKWNGVNTVKVLIVDRSNNVANQSIIDETYAHIELKRPVGASVTVESAVIKNIDVYIENLQIDINANQTVEQVKLNIKASLETLINSISLDGNIVSYAQSNQAVLNTNGVEDFLNLKLNNAPNSVTLATNEIAKFRNLYIDGALV